MADEKAKVLEPVVLPPRTMSGAVANVDRTKEVVDVEREEVQRDVFALLVQNKKFLRGLLRSKDMKIRRQSWEMCLRYALFGGGTGPSKRAIVVNMKVPRPEKKAE